jgi:hypothetical protein
MRKPMVQAKLKAMRKTPPVTNRNTNAGDPRRMHGTQTMFERERMMEKSRRDADLEQQNTMKSKKKADATLDGLETLEKMQWEMEQASMSGKSAQAKKSIRARQLEMQRENDLQIKNVNNGEESGRGVLEGDGTYEQRVADLRAYQEMEQMRKMQNLRQAVYEGRAIQLELKKTKGKREQDVEKAYARESNRNKLDADRVVKERQRRQAAKRKQHQEYLRLQIEQKKLVAAEQREQERNFRSTGNTLETPALKAQMANETSGYEVRGVFHKQAEAFDYGLGEHFAEDTHQDVDESGKPKKRYDMLSTYTSSPDFKTSVNPPWWVEEDDEAATPFYGTKRATETESVMANTKSFAPERSCKKRAEWFD